MKHSRKRKPKSHSICASFARIRLESKLRGGIADFGAFAQRLGFQTFSPGPVGYSDVLFSSDLQRSGRGTGLCANCPREYPHNGQEQAMRTHEKSLIGRPMDFKRKSPFKRD